MILCDERISITGSWNWLSHKYGATCAKRDIMEGIQIRKESSILSTHPSVIRQMKESIDLLIQK